MRDEILFQEEFERVGNRLAEAEDSEFRERNARAVWPNSILNPCANFALGINGVGNQAKDQAQKPERLSQRSPHKKRLRRHEKSQNLHK